MNLFKDKILPSTAEQELVMIFIDLFWRSIGERKGVSHPKSEG